MQAHRKTTTLLAGFVVLLTASSSFGGYIATWGDNTYGQVDGTPLEGNFAAIAAGDHHCLAAMEGGALTGWGLSLIHI